MDTERIRQLQQYYEEDPDDPFNIYALALEYLRIEPAKTRELFNMLLQRHARYLPTYYHAAKFYHDARETEKAIDILEKGIALAKQLNDNKSLKELLSAHDEMTFE